MLGLEGEAAVDPPLGAREVLPLDGGEAQVVAGARVAREDPEHLLRGLRVRDVGDEVGAIPERDLEPVGMLDAGLPVRRHELERLLEERRGGGDGSLRDERLGLLEERVHCQNS